DPAQPSSAARRGGGDGARGGVRRARRRRAAGRRRRGRAAPPGSRGGDGAGDGRPGRPPAADVVSATGRPVPARRRAIGQVLIAAYAVFAVAAGARSFAQIVTKLDEAPVAYLLSA